MWNETNECVGGFVCVCVFILVCGCLSVWPSICIFSDCVCVRACVCVLFLLHHNIKEFLAFGVLTHGADSQLVLGRVRTTVTCSFLLVWVFLFVLFCFVFGWCTFLISETKLSDWLFRLVNMWFSDFSVYFPLLSSFPLTSFHKQNTTNWQAPSKAENVNQTNC